MSEPIMQFFKYDHLPEKLQVVSKPFGDLATIVAGTLPTNAERSVALRKLLEAKDAAVRAVVAVAVLLLFLPHAAFAQVVGAAADQTFAQLAQSVLDAIKSGNGWVIAGVLVSALTWGLRNGILNKLPWPAAVTWLHDHPAAGFATPFVLSALGGVFASLSAGGPIGWSDLVMSVLKVGVTAIGTFVATKTITESHDVGKLAAAGVAGAADPVAAALAEMDKKA